MKLKLALAGLSGCFCLIATGNAVDSGSKSEPAETASTEVAVNNDSAPPAAAPAESSNPYDIIVTRNIFRLNPPPPPPVPEAPKVDLPKVKLSGFMRTGRQVRVLFASQPKDGKLSPAYYNLTEGEEESGGEGQPKLELVRIHPAQDSVDVLIDGTPVTLSVEDDSASKQNDQGHSPMGNRLPHFMGNRNGMGGSPYNRGNPNEQGMNPAQPPGAPGAQPPPPEAAVPTAEPRAGGIIIAGANAGNNQPTSGTPSNSNQQPNLPTRMMRPGQ